jgi:hypothetical protein
MKEQGMNVEMPIPQKKSVSLEKVSDTSLSKYQKKI